MFGLGSDESFRLLYLVLLLAFVAMGLRLSRGGSDRIFVISASGL